MPPLTRKALRQTLRQNRRALSGHARAWREQRIIQALRRALISTPAMRHSQHIALYSPADGEPDLRPLLHILPVQKKLFLPILAHGSRLTFAPWHAQSLMRPNRLNIPEPRHSTRQRRRAGQLDLILMPLVGFDDHGNRLGMGGGFYDRSLAFRHARHHWRKPLLIGVAFELQRCPPLPIAAWDVPLDGIVTEHGLRLFKSPSIPLFQRGKRFPLHVLP
jgi:5-formyltetrahydrofolate cyclo-ligase